VQIGTANFVNPCATTDIIDGIETYLRERDIPGIKTIVGTLDT
jgi:dihydroorotate dehydrogenase (NAD+) catalytic subunit